MEKEEQQSGLKRSLNLLDATAISVGAIIGGGIFVVTGIVADLAGSALVISMILAAIIALFTALSYGTGIVATFRRKRLRVLSSAYFSFFRFFDWVDVDCF